MSLELLSNDLLLYLFEYFNEVDIYRGLYGLNYRFNCLIFTHRQNLCFDFRSISKNDFEMIPQKYIPMVVDRVTSLYLSNGIDTAQQLQHFLGHYMPLHTFINLRSLSLYYIYSNKLLKEISEEWRRSPHLAHLSVAKSLVYCQPELSQQLVDSIWCLPKLICCHLTKEPPQLIHRF